MAKNQYSNWVPEDRYKKAVWHFHSQVNSLLQVTYSMHGYKDFAPEVAQQITDLAELFGMVVRGRDIPIVLWGVHKERSYNADD